MFFLQNLTSFTPTESVEHRLGGDGKALGNFIVATCGQLQKWYQSDPPSRSGRRVLTIILAPEHAVRVLLMGDTSVSAAETIGVTTAVTGVVGPPVTEGPVMFTLQYSLVEQLSPLFTESLPVDPTVAAVIDKLGEAATVDNVALAILESAT